MKRQGSFTTKPVYGKVAKPKYNRQNAGIVVPMKSLRAPESKRKDINFSASVPPFGTWAGPFLINGLLIGGNIDQRVGRKVNYTTVQMKTAFNPSQVTPPVTDTSIRVLVVWDKQANGSLPTVTQVVSNDDAETFMNLDNRERFEVLHDSISPYVGVNKGISTMKFYKRINKETIYNFNTGGDIGDINTGSILVMYCNTDSNFGTPLGTAMRFRVRFTDY